MTQLDRRLLLLLDVEDIPLPDWYDAWKAANEKATKEDLIVELMRTEDGRQRLAAAMVSPLRRQLDYVATARRMFVVEPLPDGALPIYDRDYEPLGPAQPRLGTREEAERARPGYNWPTGEE